MQKKTRVFDGRAFTKWLSRARRKYLFRAHRDPLHYCRKDSSLLGRIAVFGAPLFKKYRNKKDYSLEAKDLGGMWPP